MTLLVVYVVAVLLVSFMCSVLEAVMLSVSASYITVLRRRRPQVGRTLADLNRNIDRPLAAILGLNTVSHTVGAAGVGAQAMVVFGRESVAVISAVLTLLILVISEIVPKTLGTLYWRRLAPSCAYILRWLVPVTFPLVWLARVVASPLGRGAARETVSRTELAALAQVVEREGVVDAAESRVMRNLLRFRYVRGRSIMTPRDALVGFEERDTVASAVACEDRLRFSRFPVFRTNPRHITGYVLKHDMMLALAHGREHDSLASLQRPLLSLPASARLPKVLDAFIAKREHMILLTDRRGHATGIVTLEDVLETLLGRDIEDETDCALSHGSAS